MPTLASRLDGCDPPVFDEYDDPPDAAPDARCDFAGGDVFGAVRHKTLVSVGEIAVKGAALARQTRPQSCNLTAEVEPLREFGSRKCGSVNN